MSQTNTPLPLTVVGHLVVKLDGEVVRDEYNHVHPQNLARVFARALSREDNYYINRLAFGNGGTTINAANEVSYRTPNDGQQPDVATWNSRLYNEVYSEVVALNSPSGPIGTDPGSADANTGDRAGGGDSYLDDPTSVPHVSGPGVRSSELGLTSIATITCTLNGNEPISSVLTDQSPTDTGFIFDEIGLYTAGESAIDTSGYQYIDVGNRTSTDDSGLVPGSTYSFNIVVDGGTPQTITFTVPIAGGSGTLGEVLYGDICEAFNNGGDPAWNITPAAPNCTLSISDVTDGTFPSIVAAQTFGYLKFESTAIGPSSSIELAGANTQAWLSAMNPSAGATLKAAVNGTSAGLQNSPVTPSLERERLLTHVIFSPVLKSPGQTLTITYTLSISVARTQT